MPQQSSNPHLDYVPGAPLRRQKRFRRAIILGLLLSLAIAGYLFHGEIWRITKIHYYQHQCGNYVAPGDQSPDQPVLLQNAAGTPTVPNPRDYIVPAWNSMTLENPRPEALEKLIAAYQASPAAPVLEPEATVFLHNLTDPSGHRRLIWASVTTTLAPTDLFSSDHVVHVRLVVRVFPDFAFLPPAACMGLPVQSQSVELGIANGPLRVSASQPDPADASHFVVRYEVGEKPHEVDVRLQSGGVVVAVPR